MSEIKTNKISPRKGTTQTIGDSGDTITVSSGVNVCNAGTLTVSNLTNSGTITSTGTLTTAGISGGTINNTTGTISGLQQVINWDTTAKTANFNAAVQTGYFVNTTSGAITVTFPASPTAGDMIAIKDYALTADTNAITINPNGKNLNGSSANYSINIEGASGEFIYVDATRGWVLTDASKASDIVAPAFTIATGGTITTCGDYKIHTFTGPGTFCVSQIGDDGAGGPSNVDYMVVAGGGGGGANSAVGGGGGAGGYRESHCSSTSGCYTASPLATPTSLPVSVTGYPVTVGAGSPGSNGSNSVFSTITSAGGGRGGQANPATVPNATGEAGGSGGGASTNGSTQGSPGLSPWFGPGNNPPVSPPQGNPGGRAYTDRASFDNGGGGGGAGAAGSNGNSSGPAGGGSGGSGSTSSINGTPTTRAGGGGGAGYSVGGPGGSGGGGNGAGSGIGSNGSTNTGGGAGGSNWSTSSSASGGSGIVIIRYKYQ